MIFRSIALSIALLALMTPARAQGGAAGRAPAGSNLEDYRAFGLKLEGAIRDCNPWALAGMLNRDALLGAITEGKEVPEVERTKFFATAAPGLGLGSVICKKISSGGSCRFVGITTIRGTPCATMRIVSEGGVFDYYEFLLEGKGDDVRFTDVFLLSAGDLFSDFVRKSISSEPEVAIYPYLPAHSELPIGDVISQMVRLEKRGDREGILRSYDTLAPELQRMKPVLLHALSAAGAVRKERFRDLLDTLRSNYPDDPSLDLYLIQYFESQEDYGSVLAAVDAIDHRVHDPWLHTIRAKACMLGGRYPMAKRFANAAIAYDSTLLDPRWVLVVVALKERNFKEGVRLVDYISQFQNVEPYIAELVRSNVGKEFISSREYRKWKETRGR